MEPTDADAATTRRHEFAPTLESIGPARDAVSDALSSPDVDPPLDPSLVADIKLVVSELVTNAVTHGSGPAVLAISMTPSHVHTSVTSASTEAPPSLVSAAAPSRSARSGRGLAIVEALADTVVSSIADSTWTVDCEFARR